MSDLKCDYDWHIYEPGQYGFVGEYFDYRAGDLYSEDSPPSVVVSFNSTEIKDKYAAKWKDEQHLPLGVNAEYQWKDSTDIRLTEEAFNRLIPFDGLQEGQQHLRV